MRLRIGNIKYAVVVCILLFGYTKYNRTKSHNFVSNYGLYLEDDDWGDDDYDDDHDDFWDTWDTGITNDEVHISSSPSDDDSGDDDDDPFDDEDEDDWQSGRDDDDDDDGNYDGDSRSGSSNSAKGFNIFYSGTNKLEVLRPTCEDAGPADVFIEVTNTKRNGKIANRDVNLKVTLTVVNMSNANLKSTMFKNASGSFRLSNFEGKAESFDTKTGNHLKANIIKFEVDYKVVGSLDNINENDHVMLIVSKIPKNTDGIDPAGIGALGGRISAVEKSTIANSTFTEVVQHELGHNLSLTHSTLNDLMYNGINGITTLTDKKRGDVVTNFLSHDQGDGNYKDSTSGATYDCNKSPESKRNIKNRVKQFIAFNRLK